MTETHTQDVIERLRRFASVGGGIQIRADDLAIILASHDKLVEALKPFAATAEHISQKASDGSCWAGQTPAPCITHGHLRQARAALKGAPHE